MTTQIESYLGSNAGGTYVAWEYEDASGCVYGAWWYGPLAECEARRNSPPPRRDFILIDGVDCGAPPYDSATFTGMYDAW